MFYIQTLLYLYSSTNMDYLLFYCITDNDLLNELHVSYNDVSQFRQLDSLPILDMFEKYIDLNKPDLLSMNEQLY